MSIGPSIKDEGFTVSGLKQAGYVLRKTFASFFQNTFDNIFYFSLLLCMIVLAFGKKLPFEFYIILGIMFLIKI